MMNDFNGKKILVVEDNYMSYKLLEAHFGRVNLSVIHASDGIQAIDLFREHDDISIILMDIQLPGMSGLEVTKKIRELDQEIPIVAATANVFDDDRIACMEAGCSDYVSKPIDFPGLFEIIVKYTG